MDSLPTRYASALLSVAKDENKINEFKNAFNDFYDLLNDNEEISKILESYFIKEDERYKFVDELTEKYQLKNFSSFIKLLIKKHRFIELKHIKNEFNKLANQELGIFDGYVYSVNYLTKEQIKKIEDSISGVLRHKVELTNKIDESLIGGVKVAINDHVFDGSIKYKLANMKQMLNERSKNNEN